MPRDVFCTAVNCIDGRAQRPVWDWLRYHCNVDYVDMITEPGAEKCLVQGHPGTVDAIKSKVKLSLEGHGSSVIAVAGHHDCLINPASREKHWGDIVEAARIVESWGFNARVIGLYVNEWFTIELVTDTKEKDALQSHL
ncbi:MAG TPA: carbonic anhydrase [Pyrinomonadaceae bacterium]|nr:carbonic anhydrase [Pyrinomonadaceae bacterium]